MPHFRPTWHLFLAPFGLLAVGWCLASLWFPFGWDQGIGAVAGDVVLSGGLPYRDAFDMKGPLVYYTFAAAQALFGRHMWSIRAFEIGLLVAVAPGFCGALIRLASWRVAAWCGIALIFCVASMTWFHVSQPDFWASLLLMGALAPLLGRDAVSPARLFGGGLLVGLAALFKPFFAVFGLVLLVRALAPKAALSAKLRPVGALLAGCALPVLTAVWLLAWQGALYDAFAALVLFNVEAYAGIQHLDALGGIREALAWLVRGTKAPGIVGVAALPAVALGVYGLWLERRSDAVTLVLWLGIALGCVVLQGKYYVYHWAIAFAPCAILGGFGIHWLFHAGGSAEGGRAGRAMAVLTAAVFLITAAPTPAGEFVSWGKLVSGRESREEQLRSFGRFGYNAAEVVATARYVREHTEPGEFVAIFGYPATVVFLAGRKSPSRFIYSMPLLLPGNPRREAFRAEYLEGLKVRSPAYVVHGIHGQDSAEALADFPELGSLLERDYTLEERIGRLDLYRRNAN
jgi:hypothetical protein